MILFIHQSLIQKLIVSLYMRRLGLSLNGPLGTSLNSVLKRPPPVRGSNGRRTRVNTNVRKNILRKSENLQPKPRPLPKTRKKKPPVRIQKSVWLTPPSPQPDKSASPNVNYPGRNPLFKKVTRNEPYPTNPSGTRRFRRTRIVWADEPDFRNL